MKSCRNVNVHAVLSQYIVEGTKELEKFKIEYVLVVFFSCKALADWNGWCYKLSTKRQQTLNKNLAL